MKWIEKIKSGIEQKFELKILIRLLKEIWLQSDDCTEQIQNIWFSIQEVSKYTGYKREEIRKYLNLIN